MTIDTKVLEKLNLSRDALDNLYERNTNGEINFNYEYIYILGKEIDFQFRSGLLRGIIIGRGYSHQIAEIVDNLNKAVQRIIPDRKPIYRQGLHTCIDYTFSRAINDQMLHFGADYIDRWIMYHELFGGEKTKEQGEKIVKRRKKK